MRIFFCIALLLPQLAHAELSVKPVVVQKGVYMDEPCDEGLKERRGSIWDFCKCSADIVSLEITGGVPEAVAARVNADIAAYFAIPEGKAVKKDVADFCTGKEVAADGVKGATTVERSMVLESANDTVAVFKQDFFYYGAGAAHGLPMQSFHIADLSTGAAITYRALFGDDLESVNAAISVSLLKKKEMLFDSAIELAEEKPAHQWLSKENLDITAHYIRAGKGVLELVFNVYHVGPYAAGPIKAALPVSLVKHEGVKQLVGKQDA